MQTHILLIGILVNGDHRTTHYLLAVSLQLFSQQFLTIHGLQRLTVPWTFCFVWITVGFGRWDPASSIQFDLAMNPVNCSAPELFRLSSYCLSNVFALRFFTTPHPHPSAAPPRPRGPPGGPPHAAPPRRPPSPRWLLGSPLLPQLPPWRHLGPSAAPALGGL